MIKDKLERLEYITLDDREIVEIMRIATSPSSLVEAITKKMSEKFQLRQAPEWISVTDRLPAVSATAKDFQLASGESDQVLIVLGGDRKIATYHANIDTWSIPFHHGDWKPTHWQALPSLPKASE